MSDRPVGSFAIAIARRLLDRDDVRRVVAPTVADLRFEHDERIAATDGPGAWRVRLAGYVTLTRLIGGLHLRARARRLTGSAPWLLLASVAAALVAAPALSAESRRLATSHVAHVAVGVIVATALATTAARALRRAAPAALALVLLPLALVAVWGHAHEGARRWLEVGSLQLHVSALVAPAWAIAAGGLATSPRRLLVACLSVFALLVATRDPGAVVLYAAAVVASCPPPARRLRAALLATAVIASGAAAWRQPAVAPLRHVEGVLELVGAASEGARLAAVGALAAVVVGACALARRVPAGFAVRTSRAIAAYLLLASVGALALGGAIPFVSYGGSGVVGGMAMIGILASLGGTRASGVSARR